MKYLTKTLFIIALAAMLGACASQAGGGNEREYRNPYLRAKHIAAPVPPMVKQREYENPTPAN